MLYSEKVMDHFQNPRNVGKIEDADGIGEVGNAKCGDIMKIYLKIENDIIVDGVDNIKVSVAKCCNPVPGDEIIGYITKGEGVSVHKIDCPNVKGLTTRLIDVKWNNAKDKLFVANLVIKTNSSQNHILDIVTKASTRNVSLNGINEVNMGEYIDYHISVKVESVNELGLFIDELKTLSYVMEIIRWE